MYIFIDGDEVLYKTQAYNARLYVIEGIPRMKFRNMSEVYEFIGDKEDFDLTRVKQQDVDIPFTVYKRNIESLHQQLKDTFPKADLVYCFSGFDNFRYKIDYPRPYKGNRSKEKPPKYWDQKEFIIANYDSLEDPDLEADDLLGIKATEYPDSVIVSQDKDLLMIPGKHYNFNKPELGVIDVNEDEAMLFFYKQMLTGDTTDNIMGVPKIGPKKAEAALENCRDCIKTVYGVYRDAWRKGLLEGFKSIKHAIRSNGQLLWIKRHRDKEFWDYGDWKKVL